MPVLPCHAKYDNPIGFGHPFENLILAVLRVLVAKRNDPLRDFLNGLVEFALSRIAAVQALHELFDVGLYHTEACFVILSLLSMRQLP